MATDIPRRSVYLTQEEWELLATWASSYETQKKLFGRYTWGNSRNQIIRQLIVMAEEKLKEIPNSNATKNLEHSDVTVGPTKSDATRAGCSNDYIRSKICNMLIRPSRLEMRGYEVYRWRNGMACVTYKIPKKLICTW